MISLRLCVCSRTLQLGSQPTEQQVFDFSQKFSSSPRDVFAYASRVADYENLVIRAAPQFNEEVLEMLLLDDNHFCLNKPGLDGECHKVILYRRSTRGGSYTTVHTRYVFNILWEANPRLWRSYGRIFYDQLVKKAIGATLAGWILERRLYEYLTNLKVEILTGPRQGLDKGDKGTITFRRRQASYFDDVSTPVSSGLSEALYYIPKFKNHLVFDSFIWEDDTKTVTLFQVNAGDETTTPTASVLEDIVAAFNGINPPTRPGSVIKFRYVVVVVGGQVNATNSTSPATRPAGVELFTLAVSPEAFWSGTEDENAAYRAAKANGTVDRRFHRVHFTASDGVNVGGG